MLVGPTRCPKKKSGHTCPISTSTSADASHCSGGTPSAEGLDCDSGACAHLEGNTHTLSVSTARNRIPSEQRHCFQTFFPCLSSSVEEEKLETILVARTTTEVNCFPTFASAGLQERHAIITAATASHMPHRAESWPP